MIEAIKFKHWIYWNKVIIIIIIIVLMMMMMISRGRGYSLVKTIQDYSGYITKTEYNIFALLYTEQKKMEVMFLFLHWGQATQSMQTWHDCR